MKVQAVWNGQVLAESDETIMVEGNHYFPPKAVKTQYFEDSNRRTVCPWKGVASYYDIVVAGERNAGGAWYYPEASAAAKQIENYVAFWQGVRVEKIQEGEAAA
jgi:uncharacterized protein (DUF427 family)